MEFGGLISSSNGVKNGLQIDFFNKGNPFIFCADYKNPFDK